MPRPNLKQERTDTILDAMEHCIIRDGVSGVTLEKIAEQAGMQRSLLRHNIGNREQLIEAYLARFAAQSQEATEQILNILPMKNRIPALLSYLFDEQYANHRLAQIALSLTAAAVDYPSIRKCLRQWNKNFIAFIAQELTNNYPDATSSDCFEVACGLTGIYFNSESLTPLGALPKVRNGSKQAAIRLVATLNKP